MPRHAPAQAAAVESDVMVTATGDQHVMDVAHLAIMQDGCILANSGHCNGEITIPALANMATRKQQPRACVDAYELTDGRRICLSGEGRLVHLAAAERHPPTVMDMSFAKQALSVRYMMLNQHQLEHKVYGVPSGIDLEIARLKLVVMGIRIDHLSEEQQAYLTSWEEGT